MARKISNESPALTISFWNTGLYTYRDPLFAQFKSFGINLVQLHDALIDGKNMEVTDRLEISRRPGFSVFCPVRLPGDEVIRQFYSYRNLNGQVVSLFDSSVRLASFTNTGVTTFISKTTSDQGYVTSIGNMVYFSDGAAADYFKYDGSNETQWGLAAPTITPTLTGLGFWEPDTTYALNDSILDTNGNIESITNVNSSNGGSLTALSFGTKTLAGSADTGWAAFSPYYYSNLYQDSLSAVAGYTEYAFFYNFGFAIPVGSTIVGISVTMMKVANDTFSTIVDNVVKLVIGGSVVGTDHSSATPWSQVTLTNITYGGPGDTWGASPTVSQINNSAIGGFGFVISANVTANPYGQALPLISTPTITVYYTTPSGHGGPGISGENEPIWATTLGGSVNDGGVAWTNYGPIETWYPLTNYPVPVVVLDSNGYLQLATALNTPVAAWNDSTGYTTGEIVSFGGSYWVSVYGSTNTGIAPTSGYTVATTSGSTTTTQAYWAPAANPSVTGSIAPVWSTTVGAQTVDGQYTWTNIGFGTGLAFIGYSYVYGYRTIYGHLTTASPYSNNTGAILGPVNATINSYTITSNVVTFYGNNNFQIGDTFQPSKLTTTPGIYLNGQSLVVTAATPSATFALTSVSVTSNVLTIAAVNNLVSGQSVTFNSVGTATFLNGVTVTVLASGLSSTQFEANLTHVNYGPTGDTGNVVLNGSFSAAFTYGNTTNTADSGVALPLITTVDGVGTLAPINNLVQLPNTTAGTGVAAAVPNSHWAALDYTSVTAGGNGSSGNNATAHFGSVYDNRTGYNQVAVMFSVGTNTLVGGAGHTVWSVSISTNAGSSYTTVISGTEGQTAVPQILNIPISSTTPVSQIRVNVSVTPDSTDTSGSVSASVYSVAAQAAPTLGNSTAIISAVSVSANIVTVYASNNFQPGLWVTLIGLTGATFLNNQQLQVIAVDQPVGTQNTWFQVYFETPNYMQTSDFGLATFNAVEIYRTSDGGGLYLFDGAVTNPGENVIWTFNDFVTDANLDVLLVAALAHQNDPPPGAPGSSIQTVGTITAYWQGRIWMAVGNYVYFDAGPDCTNGIPEESWPPGNRFQFAGPVIGLEPTADGVGLIVCLADRYKEILGGPETISFYDTDFLGNFGISNPNAIFRDGSIIGQFTTQAEYFELIGKEKEEIGQHIADYLSANFNPLTTYATMHRNGLDVGMFVSNGVDRVERFGSNIGAWSVPCFPSFGAGALRSIETSVGVYSLMLATPNGGSENYLYARDVNSWGDGGTFGENNGTPYTDCNVVVGSITLSQPGGNLFPLEHVIGYFDAVGTLNNGGSSYPDVWILPNEINDTKGIGFVYLPEILQEPPEGQNHPSASLLALRFPVNMINSSLASQYIHHLQVKIVFQSELAPNTIKQLAFSEQHN